MSLDDFYLLGSGLMMTQTSNDIFNSSLFDAITPNSLLAWQRVRLAHSLAHSGEEWAKTFSKYNSGRTPTAFPAVNSTYMLLLKLWCLLLLSIVAGTYNNQYMVLDRSKVKLGSSIDDGALTIVEQIPGYVEYSDQTPALRRGNSPSSPFCLLPLVSPEQSLVWDRLLAFLQRSFPPKHLLPEWLWRHVGEARRRLLLRSLSQSEDLPP